MSSSTAKKPTVIGGKLKLKGDPGSSSSKKRKVVDVSSVADKSASTSELVANIDVLTDAQKRYKQKKIEMEAKEVKKQTAVSFREKIEKFNNQLSSMTEHNDIPRISAAGNG